MQLGSGEPGFISWQNKGRKPSQILKINRQNEISAGRNYVKTQEDYRIWKYN